MLMYVYLCCALERTRRRESVPGLDAPGRRYWKWLFMSLLKVYLLHISDCESCLLEVTAKQGRCFADIRFFYFEVFFRVFALFSIMLKFMLFSFFSDWISYYSAVCFRRISRFSFPFQFRFGSTFVQFYFLTYVSTLTFTYEQHSRSPQSVIGLIYSESS